MPDPEGRGKENGNPHSPLRVAEASKWTPPQWRSRVARIEYQADGRANLSEQSVSVCLDRAIIDPRTAGDFHRAMVRSFAEIPGPKSYPIVGTLLQYLPIVGHYRFDELHVNGLKKYRKYGAVVKEEIVPGTNVIWIFAPSDIQELFKREGRFPERRSHLALDHYRLNRRHLYNTGGLLPTNGSEWYRLRSAFQKGLSSLRSVRAYLPQVNQVVDEFIDRVSCTKNPRHDFLPDLSRLFLEVLGLVAFDRRLNSFSEEELGTESRTSQLIRCALTINSCILRTDNGLQLWRRWETPLYKRFKLAHEYIERGLDQIEDLYVYVRGREPWVFSVAVSLVKDKISEARSESAEKSLLETYLLSSEVDFRDVIGMCVDMLLAGIDTITYSTAFALYNLATNVDKQEKLHAESLELLEDARSAVTGHTLTAAEYLKAVLKESFRLNPVSVGVGRILPEDATFSGYRIPKGNIVVTQNQVTCRLEEYFSNASKFVPERWLKGGSKQENVNPYLVLPFGHGPRACIARRLAEQNMQTVILKVCRNFSVEWSGTTELSSKSYLINKPDGPLRFRFIPRQRRTR